MLKTNQRGQSMVELIIIMGVMGVLILGAIQFALIYNAKTTLNYATFEAARSGSLHQADFKYIKEGFARGLAPLYSYTPDGNDHIGAFQRARDKVLSEIEGEKGFVRIERLSPTESDFDQFASSLTQHTIPNDNLRYRSSLLNDTNHRSIQDANLLHLRITYWYPLYVPMVNCLIYKFVPSPTGSVPIQSSEAKGICTGKDMRIPLTSVSAIRMQSSARESSGFFMDNENFLTQ